MTKASLEKRSNWGIFDVSLILNDTDHDDIAKRSLLMSDTTLIGFSNESVASDVFLESGVDEVYGGHIIYSVHSNVNAHNLGIWIKKLRMHLETGSLFYLPKTKYDMYVQGFGGDNTKYNHLFDAVVESGKVRTYYSKGQLKNNFIRFLAEIPVPEINDVPLESFVDVLNNELESANSFKQLLRERFLDLDAAKGGEYSESDMLRVGNLMAKEAKLACSDLSRLSKRQTIQAAGVTIGTGLAVLVALNTEMFAHATPLISGAGGLGALYKVLDQHYDNQEKREKNPYLFVWLLVRK